MTDPRAVGMDPGEEATIPEGWSERLLGSGGQVKADAAVLARVAILDGRPNILRQYAATEVEGDWPKTSRIAAAGYAAWLEGDAEEARHHAGQLEDASIAGFRIDALLLRALSLLDENTKEALKAAREASKLARNGSFTHWEFLSALVLVRARRYNQQPVAASVIAQALRKWVPAAYEPWLDWESALCTTGDDPSKWARDVAALQRAWTDHAPFSADGELLASLQVASNTPFSKGEVQVAPRGLGGVFGTRGTLIYGKTGEARRLLPFVKTPEVTHDLRHLDSPRQLALVATLMLRGELTFAEAFRDTYHLEYMPGRHQQTFRVLLHRTRKMLPPEVSLVRVDDCLTIEAQGTVALFDPRTVPFEEGAILTLFQQSSRLSTAEVASARSMPRRTVQDALRRLVEQGVLKLEGRSTYVCEDTVFSEPTRAQRRER